jgi:predicted enzyme related to lactoylglutathione lyase
MPERDVYLPGVPCWVDTSQPDADAAVAFYHDFFGWDFEDVMPPEAPGRYLLARLHGGLVGAVGSEPEGGGAPHPAWNTYVAVDSADDAAERARNAGGTVLMEPFDVMDAGRMAVLADPEGAVFQVWQARGTIGAEVVNEPGSLNFNGLNTRDPARAEEFYGAVFGWKAIDVGGDSQMWALPGYGDHLEERTPGLRKMMAEMGAPPGFEDVVAAIVPIPDDQPDTPAFWSVTFAVENADAAAARAQELGATVVMPPFDAPWVRMAGIRDPQGAFFIASQFVAENKDLAG